MEASEFVRYRANVTSLAKGGFTIDATVEVQRTDDMVDGVLHPIETEVLARLDSFVAKLREKYPGSMGGEK